MNKIYTPTEFAKKIIKFNPEDYIEITSYQHHDFYKKFILEIPDNWSHDQYYNVPVEDMLKIMRHAIKNNHSIVWCGDISEGNFSFHLKFGAIRLKKSDSLLLKRDAQKYRQYTFDNFTTTDDHLMHLIGLAKNKKGKLFFLAKDSSGPNCNKYGGYLYMSQEYIKLKTIAIMVNKKAIPKAIAQRLLFNRRLSEK